MRSQFCFVSYTMQTKPKWGNHDDLNLSVTLPNGGTLLFVLFSAFLESKVLLWQRSSINPISKYNQLVKRVRIP